MNRMERLTAIVLFVREKARTSEEIAGYFEVSKRTILRDVQALCEMGVPVIAKEGPGGGYSLPGDYSFSPLPLTRAEATLLLLALSAIEPLSDAPFADERATLQAKLRALVPDRHRGEVQELMRRLSIWVPESSQKAPCLEPLLAAAKGEQWVSAMYRSPRGVSHVHVLPLRVSSDRGLWYCEAYSHEHGEVRRYRADRFVTVAVAEPPTDWDGKVAELDYHDPSNPEVVAKLTPGGVLVVEREPNLGGSIQPAEDGGMLRFRCPSSELNWFARYFLSLGEDAEVLGPPELCERIREIAEKILSNLLNR